MAANYSDDIGPMAYPMKLVSSEMVEHMMGWNIPEEHQAMVHAHWRSFPAVSKYYHFILALIYTMLMVTSLVGNGIVIWIFSTSKSLRSASNMFVINLAVFDLMMMIEMPLLIANSFYQHPIGFQLGCDVYAVLGSISGIGGAITNAVIAFDRYKTISCPLDGRINKVQASLLIAFTWFWSMPFTILPALKVWGRFVPEGFLTTCSFDYFTDDQDTKVFVACIFVWSYAIPMALICYFYSQLFGAVRLHERMLQEQAKKMNVKSLASNKEDASKSVEIRIAKVAFTIFFMFVCGWTPYAFVTMTGAYGDRSLLTPVATMIPAVCCKIVSCIDPWVYAINHPRYRAELQKRLPWLGVREQDPDTVSNSNSVTTTQSHTPTAEA
ncbi:PREDICTED: opsin-3 [Papilio xuthus]|uniref:Opsin-3 n=1 Tax=Papilio xuthus TaxID=66420 RepID=A0A194QAT3_PAPXU|nr:PREDICTED: opsin-3 [Papilio xuthus]KPJ02105.1 Opsin-3 [Papilio xuthus]